jgi:Rv2175c C-terminal domain of unknown function
VADEAACHPGAVTDATDVSHEVDDLVSEWLTLPEVADRLGLPVNRARQLLTERKLAAVRRGDNAALMVPAVFLDGSALVKGLAGTLTVLRDAGYSDAEAVRWLVTPDPTLPGPPIEALRENRGTEVKRRAQALGF